MWLETMKTKTVYRLKNESEELNSEEEKSDNTSTEKSIVDESASTVTDSEEQTLTEGEVTPSEEEVRGEAFADLNAVQEHFMENHFETVFQTQERSWVPGGIQAKLLSPGILTLLKNTVSEEKRYPGKLGAFLCRQFTGRHLAVFKFKGKLKSGPARPRAIPADLKLAERPSKIVTWVKANAGKGLDGLWTEYLGENPSEEDKKAWYGDLHWLLNQGYVLLLADSTIHMAKTAPTEEKTDDKSGK